MKPAQQREMQEEHTAECEWRAGADEDQGEENGI